ncbi:MAG: UTP--glucose-1-phosphate uridylyltransferase [Butyrivibrio sp.]|jgi:UDP-N-acetylglucosamine/UDP-N-acetylgalactosamine diphosphorylase|uniref:UDP-N-acetylglucosamine/UDP-N-acetylgalactosamine diphosphorylase n=1 Tax=Butyrivibrio hungatei TaxID=185008 RepID=A0A1G5E611_9FIRM|nr:UTP--glucose-1-phosphate uridylyltransferase [Butyrivibrio hungatei]MBQ4220330.1 UTP--glucose-1-phosphate uridylyltransferase [Butyrivibrio sp.]MBR4358468.1 UTP--glucose-1-phosphate uridylyltransferase [Butyrivibrio sp.]MCR4996466.1 UTP--glucose-1-phosphate uridylyltransferase [Butyrivibrio sp.]MEE3471231.1 UTP--glucose-1-phosphate uridylyltransferase [Butyrivibrio hungatei]SCY22464.1 UDP-N-acetylglucosamine/UDP-N-acetylgalactosaminediphosphorylase [Butyrivibrio hungatei]
MNIEEAKEKLQKYGQEHVLKYYSELSDSEKQELLAQVEDTDFAVLANCKNLGHADKRGEFAPLAALQVSEIEKRKDEFTKLGVETIKAGKVAAVLLAGGMGTRLGSDNPKGMYDIGITKPVYIFQRIIENLLDTVKQADGTYIRLFIMTSEKNNDATVNFLKEKNFFGYPEDKITFFKQEMAPASDYDGKVYMESKSRISTSPNGNAGWYSSLLKAGLRDVIVKEGIEWIDIFAVDNVLQRIADPCFVGATVAAKVSCGAKVVRKNAPDEKVGVMCLEDGKPSIVEYYELSQEMMDAKDENGDPAYNYGVILNYMFNEKALYEIAQKELPLHVVEKKIPYIDENANLVKPETPNGCKFEQLVLDMIHMLDTCLPYEVVREHEFAPIKNKTGVDSVESARELCKKNGIEL